MIKDCALTSTFVVTCVFAALPQRKLLHTRLLIMLHVQSGKCFACALHRYRNQTGVEIRTVDFGGVGGIAALDPALPQVLFLIVLTYRNIFKHQLLSTCPWRACGAVDSSMALLLKLTRLVRLDAASAKWNKVSVGAVDIGVPRTHRHPGRGWLRSAPRPVWRAV